MKIKLWVVLFALYSTVSVTAKPKSYFTLWRLLFQINTPGNHAHICVINYIDAITKILKEPEELKVDLVANAELSPECRGTEPESIAWDKRELHNF